jgi:DNA-binding response OmpR family regulator
MFLSAYGSRESISKTYEVGGNLFVPKPIEPERLLKNVDLFFEQCKPPLRTKKHSIYHIHLTEGRERAPGGGIATTAPLRHPATPPERRILEESKPTSPPESNHLFKHPPLAPRPNKPAVPPRQSGLSAQMDGPTVHVPARPTPHAHPEGGSIPMPQAAVRPRVLVVEDDPDLAQLADLALSEYFEVVRAKDGIEGLEYALKYQPDVICLDIMMPKMNGYQLCQQIRSQPTFAQTPIIVMTAKTNSRDQEYSERVGADVFLPKPFDMEKLIQVCRQFTNRPDFVVRKKSRALEQRHKGAEPELPSGPRAFSREGKIY